MFEASWGLFVVASLLLIVTPGQDMVLVMSRSIAQGAVAGVATAAGVSVGLVGHTVLAGLGLGAILQASEVLFTVLKLAGAAYLVWLGIQLLRQEREIEDRDLGVGEVGQRAVHEQSGCRAVRRAAQRELVVLREDQPQAEVEQVGGAAELEGRDQPFRGAQHRAQAERRQQRVADEPHADARRRRDTRRLALRDRARHHEQHVLPRRRDQRQRSDREQEPGGVDGGHGGSLDNREGGGSREKENGEWWILGRRGVDTPTLAKRPSTAIHDPPSPC